MPGGGLVGLGARLVGARRARLAATAVTLGLSTAFVLLMLVLASELNTLETDPGALGRRYQLTARAAALGGRRGSGRSRACGRLGRATRSRPPTRSTSARRST